MDDIYLLQESHRKLLEIYQDLHKKRCELINHPFGSGRDLSQHQLFPFAALAESYNGYADNYKKELINFQRLLRDVQVIHKNKKTAKNNNKNIKNKSTNNNNNNKQKAIQSVSASASASASSVPPSSSSSSSVNTNTNTNTNANGNTGARNIKQQRNIKQNNNNNIHNHNQQSWNNDNNFNNNNTRKNAQNPQNNNNNNNNNNNTYSYPIYPVNNDNNITKTIAAVSNNNNNNNNNNKNKNKNNINIQNDDKKKRKKNKKKKKRKKNTQNAQNAQNNAQNVQKNKNININMNNDNNNINIDQDIVNDIDFDIEDIKEAQDNYHHFVAQDNNNNNNKKQLLTNGNNPSTASSSLSPSSSSPHTQSQSQSGSHSHSHSQSQSQSQSINYKSITTHPSIRYTYPTSPSGFEIYDNTAIYTSTQLQLIGLNDLKEEDDDVNKKKIRDILINDVKFIENEIDDIIISNYYNKTSIMIYARSSLKNIQNKLFLFKKLNIKKKENNSKWRQLNKLKNAQKNNPNNTQIASTGANDNIKYEPIYTLKIYERTSSIDSLKNTNENSTLYVRNFDILNKNCHKAMTKLFLKFGDLRKDIDIKINNYGDPYAKVYYKNINNAKNLWMYHNINTDNKGNSTKLHFGPRILNIAYSNTGY